tara:strand:- start:151 stop:594 length:444 start_codon:yes stop_codon:yes gene_type:complete
MTKNELTKLIEEEIEEVLSEYALVDEHYDLYEELQGALDENNETPCPQCVYEVMADALCGCSEMLDEAEYRGRKVRLGKPFLTPKGPKKRSVYVKNPKGNVVKVNFGDPNMKIRKSNKKARKSFRARHKCKSPGPRHKARYWSCKAW